MSMAYGNRLTIGRAMMPLRWLFLQILLAVAAGGLDAQECTGPARPQVFIPRHIEVDTVGNYSFTEFGIRIPPENEVGEVEALQDSGMVERLLTSLAALDSIGIPEDENALLPWLNACFLDSFELDTLCSLGIQTADGVPFLHLETVNFDGLAPFDYVLFLRDGGSDGGYALRTVVRTPYRVVYQTFGASWRGMNNAEGRMHRMGGAHADSMARRVHWFSHIADLDADGRDDLLLHDNLDCYDYSDDPKGDGWCMMDMCDRPVPYFWMGDRLAQDPIRAVAYYDSLLGSIGILEKRDAEAAGAAIRKLQAYCRGLGAGSRSR